MREPLAVVAATSPEVMHNARAMAPCGLLPGEDSPVGDGLFGRLNPESEVYSLDLFGIS